MFQIKNIIAQSNRTVRHLVEVDGTLKDLLEEWDKITLILSSTVMVQDYVFYIHDHPELKDNTGTLSALVDSINLNTYTPQVYEGSTDKIYAQWYDVWEDGYSVVAANSLFHIDTLGDESVSKPDMLLRHDGRDYAEVAKTSVFTVNGLCHPATADSNGIYLLGGGTNATALGESMVGMLDMSGIGELAYINIDEESIVYTTEDTNIYNDGLYLRIPEMHINKPICVVIAGHIHFLDGSYKFIDRDIIKFDISRMNLEAIVLEHHTQLGLSALVEEDMNALRVSRFRHNEMMKVLLNQASTFMLVIDNPGIYKEIKTIARTSLPGVFTSLSPITGLVSLSSNKIAEYLQFYEDGVYVIKTMPHLLKNYQFNNTDWERGDVINKAVDTILPYRQPTALVHEFFVYA